WGLDPLDTKEGYLQPFPSPYTIVDEAEMTLLSPAADACPSGGVGIPEQGQPKSWKLKAPEDFMPLLFVASGDTTAGVVFAGWGISAPALGYDDYAGIDPAGRFVLCFRGTPDNENEAFEEYDQHRTRMRTVKEKGALGIIYIYDKPNAHPNGDWIEGFMPAMIGEPVADSLFAEKGLTCDAIKKGLGESKKPASFSLGSRVRYRAASRHFPDGVGYNVAGLIEGSDPKLKGECVVIGGHFDHCGSHMGMIFPGANDNASGSAVVMEIAEAYAALKTKPKRSVVFVLFGGEEQGLIGANYLAEHFPARFTKIAGMFNFDMVGEGDGASCGYTPEPPELLAALEDADARVGTLRKKWEIKHVGVRSSDFAPFFLKGAPCVACFSNGPHLAYHETGDTIYRINPDILADIARLGFLASYRWANRR
ncbi:MAG: M20/M25/M40 family metallo-hydrolase, partial [Candidatus Krumholzibacteriia bacterium]